MRPQGELREALEASLATLEVVASGLAFPEGPVLLGDRSLAVVEIAAGRVTRVLPDGEKELIAEVGGGPNGAALGPDGALYICNNGGFAHHRVDGRIYPGAPDEDRSVPDGYLGGWIERVDLDTAKVDELYRSCGDVTLRSPNDLVFDRSGAFYFTDTGKTRLRDRDRGGVFYATTDGSRITEVLAPVDVPNGVGLSPQQDRLYVAETPTARLRAWSISTPGTVDVQDPVRPTAGSLVIGLGGEQRFDSLAVDGMGNIIVGTLLSGCLTVVAPGGELLAQLPMGDTFPTNACFGGDDLRTLYITLSSSGCLAKMTWPWRGLG